MIVSSPKVVNVKQVLRAWLLLPTIMVPFWIVQIESADIYVDPGISKKAKAQCGKRNT